MRFRYVAVCAVDARGVAKTETASNVAGRRRNPMNAGNGICRTGSSAAAVTRLHLRHTAAAAAAAAESSAFLARLITPPPQSTSYFSLSRPARQLFPEAR